MGTTLILLVGALVLIGFGVVAITLFGNNNSKSPDIRGLMTTSQNAASTRARGAAMSEDQIEDIKRITGSSVAVRKRQDDLSSKLFKAGYFTADDKQRFHVIRIVTFVVSFVGLPILALIYAGPGTMVFLGGIMGAFIGYAAPISILERQVRARQEDALYYLPLVIEQVSIGVSSSLDIGPCIAQIVQMATERDAHNPVTEMFVNVEKLIKSGLNLEDSLMEVAEVSGMSEIKHAFMFLAQCARHGGEISKQLQELADSVMVQRQTQIEGRITALPVKATGPLAMVFAGFFALLFAGLIVKLKNAFGG